MQNIVSFLYPSSSVPVVDSPEEVRRANAQILERIRVAHPTPSRTRNAVNPTDGRPANPKIAAQLELGKHVHRHASSVQLSLLENFL